MLANVCINLKIPKNKTYLLETVKDYSNEAEK